MLVASSLRKRSLFTESKARWLVVLAISVAGMWDTGRSFLHRRRLEQRDHAVHLRSLPLYRDMGVDSSPRRRTCLTRLVPAATMRRMNLSTTRHSGRDLRLAS
jgi:hypothetical protein